MVKDGHQYIMLAFEFRCSKLKYDLCYNLHVIKEPNCTCGAIEDAYHYFIECPNYIDFRIDLFSAILPFTQVELDVLLQGDPKLNVEQNKAIFDAVYLYFERTKRFKGQTVSIITQSSD